jgi:phage tail protein X
LGQRLDATVPVRLGPGETLTSACVSPGTRNSEFSTVPGVSVSTPQSPGEGVYALQISSAAALYEPMYELELKVQCLGVPLLVRQYVLMLDLPGAVATGAAEPAATPNEDRGMTGAQREAAPAAQDLAQESSPAPRRARETARARSTGNSSPLAVIDAGTRYRIATGDTLSAIASRVRGRTGSWQAMADAIHAANPAAFIRNDPNLIKLGSEIVIPATTGQDALAAGPAPVATAPAAPPAALPAPPAIPDAAPARSVADRAPAPGTGAGTVIAPVAVPPEQRVVARPVPRPVATSTGAAAEARADGPASDEPNPLIAAGAGILFGLLVSSLLWLRGQFPARKRAAAAPVRERSDRAAGAAGALATAPAPLVTRATEPGFSVSFTPAQEDALAAEFNSDFAAEPAPVATPLPAGNARQAVPEASEDITSELDELFDGTDTTIQKRLDAEKTVAARVLGGGAEDNDTGDTIEQTGTVDLQALAAAATGDQQQAQTLLEALTLLERDYEEELTASQVLDMSAVRQALGNDLDEPTQVSATPLREASGRKRTG